VLTGSWQPSPIQSEALAELRAAWPGYTITCEQGGWTATTGHVLLSAGSARNLADMLRQHADGQAFSRYLRLVTYLDDAS
jgi:hypothetical protein